MGIAYVGLVGSVAVFDGAAQTVVPVSVAVPGGASIFVFAATGRNGQTGGWPRDTAGNAYRGLPFSEFRFDDEQWSADPISFGAWECHGCAALGGGGQILFDHANIWAGTGDPRTDQFARAIVAVAFTGVDPNQYCGQIFDAKQRLSVSQPFSSMETPRGSEVLLIGGFGWSGRKGADSLAFTLEDPLGAPVAGWNALPLEGTDTGRTIRSDWRFGTYLDALRDRCLRIGYRIINPADRAYTLRGTVATPQAPADVAWEGHFFGYGPGAGGGTDARAGSSPCVLETLGGMLYEAYAAGGAGSGGIGVVRSDHTTPPYTLFRNATTVAGDTGPCLAEDHGRLVLLLFTRTNGAGGTDVWETISDEDGISWSTPTMAFANGKHGVIAVDPQSGAILRAAYVGGVIQGTLQFPGDPTPSAPFTVKDAGGANLAVADERFDFAWAVDSPRRVIMAAKKAGATSITDFISRDCGQTFEEI